MKITLELNGYKFVEKITRTCTIVLKPSLYGNIDRKKEIKKSRNFHTSFTSLQRHMLLRPHNQRVGIFQQNIEAK